MTSPPTHDILADTATLPLLPAQRRQHIVEFLHRHGAVTLQQLEQALRVSVSTLRRDLDALAAEGEVDRTHGGALLRHQEYSTFEPDHLAAAELSPREKEAIGRAAAAALVPRQSVIFDSGSTVAEAARAALARRIPLVAVTNDLAIAQLLGSSSLVRVHVLGGVLREGSNTLTGESVIEAARAIGADVLLMGAHAVTDGVMSETATGGRRGKARADPRRGVEAAPGRFVEIPSAHVHEHRQRRRPRRGDHRRGHRRGRGEAAARGGRQAHGGERRAMSRIRILADDLTGALDSAAAFAGDVPVYLDAPALDAADEPPVAVVATATRDVPLDALPGLLAPSIRWLAAAPVAFKKVDSLLRGNTCAEAAYVARAGGFAELVFAPAFPAQRRLTQGGRHWVVPAGKALAQREPVGAGPIADAFAVLGLPVVGAAVAGDGAPRVAIPDVATDADLAAIAAASVNPGATKKLWCGSAGLAHAIAAAHGLAAPPDQDEPITAEGGPVLVISASHHPVVRRQWGC